jgi:hypothetical protein
VCGRNHGSHVAMQEHAGKNCNITIPFLLPGVRGVGSAPQSLDFRLVCHCIYVTVYRKSVRNSAYTLFRKGMASCMISSTAPYS